MHLRSGWSVWVSLTLVAVAGSGLGCSAMVRWKVRHLVRDNPQVLYEVDTQAKAIALTIDDGPDATTTPEILRVLERLKDPLLEAVPGEHEIEDRPDLVGRKESAE